MSTPAPRELPALLVEAFHRNGRVNATLLDHLTDADLGTSDGQGGLSIGQHLEHLLGFRKGWLGYISPAHTDLITYATNEGDNRYWDTTLDLGALRGAFEEGDRAALTAVQDAYRDGRTFERAYASDPAHFLMHALVHDAHHRGQITTLLRQHGRSLEQMDELDGATWPIWRK